MREREEARAVGSELHSVKDLCVRVCVCVKRGETTFQLKLHKRHGNLFSKLSELGLKSGVSVRSAASPHCESTVSLYGTHCVKHTPATLLTNMQPHATLQLSICSHCTAITCRAKTGYRWNQGSSSIFHLAFRLPGSGPTRDLPDIVQCHAHTSRHGLTKKT